MILYKGSGVYYGSTLEVCICIVNAGTCLLISVNRIEDFDRIRRYRAQFRIRIR